MTPDSVQLSILDLVPVRRGQTTGMAFRAARELVRTADRLGFTRYWVAEHHNMPQIASTTPGIELMYLGEGTDRIRLGSGGVMLPNHAPMAIAEQFAILASIHGDRIDLAIGRAPGTDQITAMAMRGHLGEGRVVGRDGQSIDPVEQFPQHVLDILDLLGPDGARVPLYGGREHILRASPLPDATPEVWLLGSSDYSARLAASLGLPYVFAHHFAGRGTAEAMGQYRDEFRPTRFGSNPKTFVSVNAVVAETAAEAEELAQPYLYSMANLRMGQPMRPLPFAGAEVAEVMTDGHRAMAEQIRRGWIISDAASAADQVRELAGRFDVDEVMVHPVAGAHEGDDPEAWVHRVRTIELLAEELLAS